MRYIAPDPRFVLHGNDGKAYRQFVYGELIEGDATTASGAGYIVDATKMQEIYTTAQVTAITGIVTGSVTALNRCGLGINFFTAPYITPGNSTVAAAGAIYKVLFGTVTYNGVTYKRGEEFISVSVTVEEEEVVVDDTSTTDGGVFALSFQPGSRASIAPNQFSQENFKIKTLGTGRETTYDPNVPGGFIVTDPKAIDPLFEG